MTPSHQVASTHCGPRQFSVRDLLKLTLVVSVLLAIGVVAEGSPHFGALSTAWTAASVLLIAAAWTADRWQLVSPRAMARAAVLGYLIALGLPALGWGDEVIFGWLAWLQSWLGLDLFLDRQIEVAWFFEGIFITIPLSCPTACACGAAANLAFLIAVAAYWLARPKPRALRVAHRAAAISTLLAIAALLPMCLTGDLTNLYPGYGLWTASALALALSTHRLTRANSA